MVNVFGSQATPLGILALVWDDTLTSYMTLSRSIHFSDLLLP